MMLILEGRVADKYHFMVINCSYFTLIYETEYYLCLFRVYLQYDFFFMLWGLEGAVVGTLLCVGVVKCIQPGFGWRTVVYKFSDDHHHYCSYYKHHHH